MNTIITEIIDAGTGSKISTAVSTGVAYAAIFLISGFRKCIQYDMDLAMPLCEFLKDKYSIKYLSDTKLLFISESNLTNTELSGKDREIASITYYIGGRTIYGYKIPLEEYNNEARDLIKKERDQIASIFNPLSIDVHISIISYGPTILPRLLSL